MDIRLIATSIAAITAIVGYILLVMTNHVQEANNLIDRIALPSLTFLIGLGSSIVRGKDNQ